MGQAGGDGAMEMALEAAKAGDAAEMARRLDLFDDALRGRRAGQGFDGLYEAMGSLGECLAAALSFSDWASAERAWSTASLVEARIIELYWPEGPGMVELSSREGQGMDAEAGGEPKPGDAIQARARWAAGVIAEMAPREHPKLSHPEAFAWLAAHGAELGARAGWESAIVGALRAKGSEALQALLGLGVQFYDEEWDETLGLAAMSDACPAELCAVAMAAPGARESEERRMRANGGSSAREAAAAGHVDLAVELRRWGSPLLAFDEGDPAQGAWFEAFAASAVDRHPRVVEELLDRGEALSREGAARLAMMAASKRQPGLLGRAMDLAGPSLAKRRGDRGLGLLSLAARKGSAGCVDQILSRGWPRDGEAMLWAARSGDAPTVRALLAAGYPPQGAGGAARTPLMAAAAEGHVEAMGALLDAGADADARDERGRTAANLCAANRRAGAFELLIERGADLGVPDDKGVSALDLARGADDRCAALAQAWELAQCAARPPPKAKVGRPGL